MQTGNFKGFLDYEIVNKPFLGSRKRAKQLLGEAGNVITDHNDFLIYLQKHYPKILSKIEYIRFYEFDFNEKGRVFHYCIAMLFTSPDEQTRTVLYDESRKITCDTGWYPYITGSRAKIKRLSYTVLRNEYGIPRKRIDKLSFGRPERIIDISNTPTASANLLQCYNGNILFDTGFGILEEYINSIDLICISHFHKDHTGGLLSILHVKPVPVLISEVTLEYLLQLADSEENKRLLISCAITLEEIKFYQGFRNHIDYFAVFHTPGSFGFIYKFYKEIAVIYFGDVCVCNAFHNHSLKLIEQVNNISTDKKVIIFDGALIGKKDESISDDKPEDIINTIENGIEKRNTIFISQGAETLVYSYILFFKWAIENKNIKAKVVVSDELYQLLRTLWRPMVYRDNFKDPFIQFVFKSEANFVETYRLYPLSSFNGFLDSSKSVFFLTVNDIENDHSSTIPVKKSDIILAGVWTIRNSIPNIIVTGSPRSIIRVSSADWSFHTNEQDIIEIMKAFCSDDRNKVILFHNYSKVLRKFIDN